MTTVSEETIARLKSQAAEGETEDEEEVTEEVEEVEEKESKSSIRDYLVFVQATGKNWQEVGRFQASSPKAAIKAMGAELKSGATYAAVPERNWTTSTAAVETVTTVTLN